MAGENDEDIPPVEPEPEPEPEPPEPSASIEERLAELAERVAALEVIIAEFGGHTHGEFATVEHEHSGYAGAEHEHEHVTPEPPTPERRPDSAHWYFKRLGE